MASKVTNSIEQCDVRLAEVGEERHKVVPSEIQKRITEAGGLNPYGEPLFRVVWGWDRLAYLHDTWEDIKGDEITNKTEGRWVPKYWPYDRWHLEKWLPAECFGSPEDWAVRCASLGPYPSQGDWEHSITIQTPKPEQAYLDLTPHIVEQLIQAVQAGAAANAQDKRAALTEMMERKRKDYERFCDELLTECFEHDAFRGDAFVPVETFEPIRSRPGGVVYLDAPKQARLNGSDVKQSNLCLPTGNEIRKYEKQRISL